MTFDEGLLGEWAVDTAHRATVERLGRARISIGNGTIIYCFEDGAQSLLTIESTNGGVIVTNQPSAPRRDETAYRIDDDGRLHLVFKGFETHFVRV